MQPSGYFSPGFSMMNDIFGIANKLDIDVISIVYYMASQSIPQKTSQSS
jgi:hypothetical protein